jgi:hypothetical protein
VSTLYVFICVKTTPDVVLPVQTNNQVDYNRRISNTFKAQAGGRLTVGDLKLRPTGSAIPNHLLCDGSAVSRLQFPELFAFLGTSEGAGDGTTTFNLPNYLGTPLTVPATAPPQVVENGTVSSGDPVTQPSTPAQTGGTEGGNVVSGARPPKPPRGTSYV